MAIVKAVSYNPRRWSAFIRKTMTAAVHLQTLTPQVWQYALEHDCTEAELKAALTWWMTTDLRLAMSLTPEGKAICIHDNPVPSLAFCVDAPVWPTDSASPFLWHLGYKKTGASIEKVWLLFRGPLGADSQLAAALFQRIKNNSAIVWPSLPIGDEPVQAQSAQQPFLAPFEPTVLRVCDEHTWQDLIHHLPGTHPLLLAGALLIQSLRALSPALTEGILFETFAPNELGPRYAFLGSKAGENASVEDILATLELNAIDFPSHKQWAVISFAAGREVESQLATDDFLVRWTIGPSGYPEQFYHRSGDEGNRLCRVLQQIIQAIPFGKKPDFLGEALAFFNTHNQTARAYNLDRSLLELVEESFRVNENRIALVCSLASFTYGEIDRASDALARHLEGLGYGPGDLIGLGLPRDETMLIALFAVLKCGAGYVPLDPSFPADRIRYMAKDAKIKACLCDELVFNLTQDITQCIALDEIKKLSSRLYNTRYAPKRIAAESIAYVIYTSGSTGMPKGVMLSHRSVVNFILSMAEAPGMKAGDKILGVTTLSFDIAVLELFLPLYTGATLVLASADEAKDGPKLSALLKDHAITHFQATASTYRLVLDGGFNGRLKKALCGGEAFPLDIARRLKPIASEIWNMYGPTETTVWSTIHRLDGSEAMIPVGRPIANTIVAILDESLQPLLPGNKGEIYIGGSGLALGYLGRPDLTQDRFFFAPALNQMVYKTGDIGSCRADGTLEISGRSDGQIKLRGYRMELGEIEAVMGQAANIAVAIAMVKEFAPDDKRLIAYLQIKSGAKWNEREFRQNLRSSLPIYMVPQHFVILDYLPLLPNGKIDRKALPHPQPSSLELEMQNSTRLALTTSQSRMLFVEALDPNSHVHNLIGAWHFIEAFHEIAFKQALFIVVKEQEALRMSIRVQGGHPEILLNDAFLPLVERCSLFSKEAAKSFIEAQSKSPLSLAQGQNFRIGIIDLPAAERIVYLITHHIFWDGFSFGVFWKSMQDHYQKALSWGLPRVRPMAYRYSHYTQAKSRQTAYPPDLLRYWKDQFTPLPEPLELAYDFPRPQELTHAAHSVAMAWDSSLDSSLVDFSRSKRVTPYHVLLSVYFILLHRLSRQDDIVIGTPVLGRHSEEVFGLLGNFINAVALRHHFGEAVSFDDCLLQIRTLAQESLSRSEYPIETLIADLNLPRDSSRTPLYNCMFFFQDHSSDKAMFATRPLEPFSVESQTVDSDLVFWVERHSSKCQAGFNFRKDLWQIPTMEAMAQAYTSLLKGFIANPSLKIDEPALAVLPLVIQATIPAPVHLNLWNWLKETSQTSPQRIAVRTLDGKGLTYGQVFDRSERIAAYLYSKGVRAGEVVGISLGRTQDLIPSLWAILSLGASYLPLDPQYPSDRLQFMAVDAQARVIITEMEFAGAFRSIPILTISIDRDRKEIQDAPAIAVPQIARPEDLAYIIYTSGSTGRPKGVEISHGAACYFLNAISRQLSLKSSIKTLGITTISFDISVLEIFATLVNGGELILVDQESVIDGNILAKAIDKFGVNLLQATPATWRLLLDSGWQGRSDLTGLCGGEALPKDLARSLEPMLAELWNVYGPTEATVWATADRVTDGETITIGKALPYYETYVLDKNRKPLPQGAIGDLYLGGPALARGYRFRPDLTEERFLPHPRVPGQRIYDTGDLARIRADGKIEYISRRDNQVKLRGFRIELGEIEASMMLHPDLKQAVCLVYEASPGDNRLLAYATIRVGKTMDIPQLHSHLRAYLPNYMLPGHLILLDTFPLTPSGKIDKKALPKPSESKTQAARGKIQNVTACEAKVIEIFKSILGHSEINKEDNFFEAGGHSLLALSLIHKLESELGLTLKIRDLLLLSVTQIAYKIDHRGAS